MDDGPLGADLSRRAVDSLRTKEAVDAAVATGRPVLRSERLPRVLHEAPAACLLVDLTSGCVVQANAVGRELAPGVGLPAAPHAWLLAAGLRRPGGEQFAPGSSPVERAADGQQVLGEPVLAGDRTLWVTAFAVPTSDDGAQQVLVVFFEVDTEDGARMRDRAVVAAGLSFTITDPHQDDDPLVFVNPAFERTTGYSYDEAVGRNCRFLQGPDTDPVAVGQVRELLAREQSGTVTLLNYRKDGTAFWNELSLSPVYDGGGRLTHFVGIQADVTSRVLAEQERERHLLAEQQARTEAEQAQRRLALLAEATSMLAATLDVDESLDRLTQLVVPLLADFCTVHLLSPDGGVQRVAATHADPAKQELLRRLEELQPAGLSDQSETAVVLRGGPPQLLTHISREDIVRAVADPELVRVYEEIGVGSAVIVPLRARRQVLGALGLFSSAPEAFDQEDLATAADLARRAALTVDNARLYQREHEVAEALQRSLLPDLPDVPGLDVAARYLPGSSSAQVGGDWYDLFRLPDGAVGIAVGDVMGHDLAAAASMGQLRSVLQSYAWQGSSPAVVLDRLDQLVQGLDMAQLATCIYGRLELPGPGQDGVLRLANAGHLPPALRRGDGHVRLLRSDVSLLVGAALGIARDETEEAMGPGSVLVLYTDGLVEHRGRDLDVGLAMLEEALSSAPRGSARSVLDALLSRMVDGPLEDDVAVLVVRVLPDAG
ncbi:MAG TPA: SpoIIE family protein phosphatase [Mycobacteriales bacterium]|nr:SpoIIE family protein phosphatase [Mycobacteriales bacterium]